MSILILSGGDIYMYNFHITAVEQINFFICQLPVVESCLDMCYVYTHSECVYEHRMWIWVYWDHTWTIDTGEQKGYGFVSYVLSNDPKRKLHAQHNLVSGMPIFPVG